MLDALHQLPTRSLRTLATSLRDGSLSSGMSIHALRQISGSKAAEVENCVVGLRQDGMTSAQISMLVDAIADARDTTPQPSSLFDLVLSGPDVPGIPTADTAAVMQTLIEEAKSQVLLVGYAVHNGQRLFKRLAERMEIGVGRGDWFRSPSLRTGLADLPHPALQLGFTSERIDAPTHGP